MFVVWHGVLKLSFVYAFHAELDLASEFSMTNSSVQYDLLQRPTIFLPLNSTLKIPGVCLP